MIFFKEISHTSDSIIVFYKLEKDGMCMSELKIGEGQKYDTTKVSEDGVKREESTKSKRKLNLIFNQFDINKDGTLNSAELARMVSVFNAADTDGSKSLSNTEFNDLAEALNEILPWGEKVSAKDVKNFFKRIMQAQQNDEKVSVEEIITQQSDTAPETDTATDAPQNNSAPATVTTTTTTTTTTPVTPAGNPESAAAAQPAVTEEAAEADEEAQTALNDYTVQNGESYNDLIKRSLKAQGIENPTDEQIKQAKENFEKNNPGAVHTSKNGVQYLLVGEKVKLEGKLEDKNNAQEEINEHVSQMKSARAAARKPSRRADNTILEKAKAQGYRATYSDKYFYDEKTKKHYYYDKKKGQFVESKNTVFVDKDGSFRKEFPNQDGSARSITYDKEGYATKMQALAYNKRIYTNRDYAAKKLGLRETFATKSKGIYYDPKTKIHFTWNPKTHTFEAMDKSVRIVGKDGKTYDKNGRADNWQIKRDGTEVHTDPNTGITSTFTYDENKNTGKSVIKDTNGNIKETHEYTYDENRNHVKLVRKDAKGNVMCTMEWTRDENGKKTYAIAKYSDGTSSERLYDKNENVTKRVIKDAAGNVTDIYSFTHGKDGSYISQKVDAQGNKIGEPIYYDKNNNELTKEQYEALQK